jgi:hypothetical protein
MKKLWLGICVLSMGGTGWAQSAPSLGSAASFAVLGSSTVTCTGATTITGSLGVSPGSAFTGFPAPCSVVGGTIHAADVTALLAHADATKAYAALLTEACNTNLTGQDLAGQTLAPGVYCFSSSAGLTGQLTLNGNGVYVFKIGSTLTTASNSSVVLTNGALCGNVFWQIGSSATLGTGTTFVGNLIALTSDTVTTNVSVAGRVIALGGAVTLDTNTITAGACASGGGGDGDRDACHNADDDRHREHRGKQHHDKDKDEDHRDDDHND